LSVSGVHRHAIKHLVDQRWVRTYNN